MFETVRVEYNDFTVTYEQVVEEIEQKTFRLLMRMWEAQLFSVNGWRTRKIVTVYATYEIINIRPYNRVTEKYYQERGNV